MTLSTAYLPAVAHNSAALWRALGAARGHDIRSEPGWVSVEAAPRRGGLRIVLTEPAGSHAAEAIRATVLDSESVKVTVEDPYDSLDLSDLGLDRRLLTAMVRPADAPPINTATDVRVTVVDDAADLAVAERLIVDGFPSPAFQPYRHGEMLPPAVRSELNVHIAYDADIAAATCCAFDDGESIGVYWVVTLAPHRSRGLGRACVTAALAAGEDRPTVLTATADGRPLYASLGFRPVAGATWWVRIPDHVPDHVADHGADQEDSGRPDGGDSRR